MSTDPWNQTYISENSFQRIFESTVDDAELVWHRDRKNRTVKIIESNGWKFQEDNKIPVELFPGDVLHIKACEYHRILKGKDRLVVEITEDQ